MWLPSLGDVTLTDVLHPSLGSVTSGLAPTWLGSSATSAGSPLGASDRFDMLADGGGIGIPAIEAPGTAIGGVATGGTAIGIGGTDIGGTDIGGMVAGGIVTGGIGIGGIGGMGAIAGIDPEIDPDGIPTSDATGGGGGASSGITGTGPTTVIARLGSDGRP